jgi:hypothetical protein
MPDVEIRPFSDEHVDAAAALLAERHERHLAAEPLLARDVDFRAQVERDFTAERASGAVAVAGGELVGYLVGRMTEDDDSLVDFAGFAARDAEVIRDLYAHVAEPWVDAGFVRHRAHVPATDVAAIDAWFRLAFGRQLTFGAREIGLTSATARDVMVRRARQDELEKAATLGSQMHQHHRRPPSFSGRPTVTDDEYREWWSDSWDKPEFVHFVASEPAGWSASSCSTAVRQRICVSLRAASISPTLSRSTTNVAAASAWRSPSTRWRGRTRPASPR